MRKWLRKARAARFLLELFRPQFTSVLCDDPMRDHVMMLFGIAGRLFVYSSRTSLKDQLSLQVVVLTAPEQSTETDQTFHKSYTLSPTALTPKLQALIPSPESESQAQHWLQDRGFGNFRILKSNPSTPSLPSVPNEGDDPRRHSRLGGRPSMESAEDQYG